MIPSEIYELATALSDEFNLDFDEAVSRAYTVFRTLEAAGFTITERDSA